jgi:CTP synthase
MTCDEFPAYFPLIFPRHDRLLKEVTIALVGKYTKLEDSYASVIKALTHASMAVNHKLNLKVFEQPFQSQYL